LWIQYWKYILENGIFFHYLPLKFEYLLNIAYVNWKSEASGIRTCKKAECQNQLNKHILNLTVYHFLFKIWYELDLNVTKCATGREVLWKSLLQGLVRLLAGFMARWEPMSEVRSTSQEELEVVNIMWWIANISSTFWVISGSSATIRTGWRRNLYHRRNIQLAYLAARHLFYARECTDLY
jgi:hypothetical protein